MNSQCDYGENDAAERGLTTEEAELRSRPFVCAVGAGCTKRYRQMNGLKYHYLNSGEHGQYGLRMIQNGTHPYPTAPGSGSSTPTSSAATSNTTPKRPTPIPGRTATAPYTIPNPNNHGNNSSMARPMPRMGVFPPSNRPITGVKTTPISRPPLGLPPSQRGRDAVLFSTMGMD